jgi:hypothetical protein
VKSTYDIVLDAATEAAIDALRLARAGKIRSMAAAEEYVVDRLGGILDVFMPAIKEEAASILAPATQQAVDAIKPAMYDVLRDWTPSFAAIVGGMAGLAILLGVYVSKRTFMSRGRR